ncbi:MAG: D-alanyl-D-alanine carboxypeptidase, serine-type,PBP4 family [Armatimonadetes bacterium OLB18]|nr:MAG: D-alanyl-D-alanine carboxypeptidase, serine-type,PBP4 family [Armatimonadetes bacterium OLB18]
MWSLLLAAALQAPLDRILTHDDLRGATVGAIVTTLDGTVLYERNSDLRLMPASNQKLLSVSYALHALGPDFRPQTRIWRLADRIAIDAPGDPSLSLADLQAAAAKVRFSDVAPIAVRQAYRVGVPSTWEHDDLPNRYAPQIMAFFLRSRRVSTLCGKRQTGARSRVVWSDGPAFSRRGLFKGVRPFQEADDRARRPAESEDLCRELCAS